MSYLYFRTLISFVVGNIPSARYLLPSRALIILDLPLLNSPTTTSKKSSSSCLIASVRRLSSSISGAASCRASLLRLLEDIFSWLEALHPTWWHYALPSFSTKGKGKLVTMTPSFAICTTPTWQHDAQGRSCSLWRKLSYIQFAEILKLLRHAVLLNAASDYRTQKLPWGTLTLWWGKLFLSQAMPPWERLGSAWDHHPSVLLLLEHLQSPVWRPVVVATLAKRSELAWPAK